MSRSLLLLFSILFLLGADGVGGVAKRYNFTGTAALWYNAIKDIQSSIGRFFRPLLKPMMGVVQRANISGDCTFDLLRVVSGFQKFDLDAITMIDAMGKLPNGMASGAITAFGNYDQCLRARFHKGKDFLFRGRYCLIHLRHTLPPKPESLIPYPMFTPMEEFKQLEVLGNHMLVKLSSAAQVFYIKTLRIGACLPSSCSRDDLERIAKEATKNIFEVVYVPWCNDQLTKTQWTTTQIVIGSLCLIYVIFVLVATVYEVSIIWKKSPQKDSWKVTESWPSTSVKYSSNESVWVMKDSNLRGRYLNGQATTSNGGRDSVEEGNSMNSTEKLTTHFSPLNSPKEKSCDGIMKRIMINFSMITNSRYVFNAPSRETEMRFVHGIRLFSIIWVIAGHTYILSIFSIPLRGTENYLDMVKSPFFNLIQNATLSVDTFFFLSGFFLFFYAVKNSKNYNIFLTIVKRILRISPAYGILIALTMLFPLLGDGPNWPDSVDFLMGTCHVEWWRKMLFIENLFGEVEYQSDCLMHGWYIAVDFQLFLLGTFLVYLIIKYPKWGIVTIIGVIIGSCVAVAVVTVRRGHYPTLYSLGIDTEFLNYVYFWPYAHAGSFFVGGLVGNFCAKNATLEFSKKKKVAFWLLSFFFLFPSFFLSYYWNNDMIPRLSPFTALYAALHRTTWGIGLAFAFLLMFYSHDDLLSRFLGLKVFFPLSRLSYGAYLVHLSVQMYFAGKVKIEIHYDHMSMLQTLVCNIVTTFFVAYLLNVFLIGPLIGLDRLLTSRGRKQQEKKGIEDKSLPTTTEISNSNLIKTRI